MGDSLSIVLCHFCVAMAAGWWVTVCHLGCVTFVLVWLPISIAGAFGVVDGSVLSVTGGNFKLPTPYDQSLTIALLGGTSVPKLTILNQSQVIFDENVLAATNTSLLASWTAAVVKLPRASPISVMRNSGMFIRNNYIGMKDVEISGNVFLLDVHRFLFPRDDFRGQHCGC